MVQMVTWREIQPRSLNVWRNAKEEKSTSPAHSWRKISYHLGNGTRQFDFAFACAQNPSKEGGIMRSKLFLMLGLVPTLSLAVKAQTVKQEPSMAHQHSPRFLQIVNESRKHVRETNVDEVKAKLDRGERLILVDVREESEFAKDHLPGAIHVSKGVIERDIEEKVPDLNAPLVLYCGGGYRSALAADNLQKMGYKNVLSMDGGIRAWREKGFPLTK
jgi:rhodanese-related sulfurtransferase